MGLERCCRQNVSCTMKERSQIEAYFRNEMNELERLTFMEMLETDPSLMSEFKAMESKVLEIQLSRLQQELHVIHSSAVNEAKSSNIKSVFEINEDESTSLNYPSRSEQTTESRGGNNRMIYFLIAGALLVIAIYFALSLFTDDKDSQNITATETKELYDEYFIPDPGLNIDPNDIDRVKFNAAMVDYKNKKYREALKQWEMLSRDMSSDTIHFYIGQSLLALDKPSEAYEQLAYITNRSIFSDKAIFYRALAQVKQGYTKEAVDLLKDSISQMSNEAVKTRSQALLDELRR